MKMIQSKFCKVCLLAPFWAALSQPAELEGEALPLEWSAACLTAGISFKGCVWYPRREQS